MATEDSNDREAKRLRSSEPDLQVVLGSGDDAVTKFYHSPMLASKSKYIDAMLSAPMKESEARKITFPDISSDVWEKMMSYFDSPAAVRKMSERDALEVAVFYDKYDFDEGRKLCDELLADYFKSAKSMEKELSLDVDLVIESLVVAKDANLFDALKRGVAYIWKKMHSHSDEMNQTTPYSNTMFTEDHMRKLVPVLLHAFSPEHREKVGCGITMNVQNVYRSMRYREILHHPWRVGGNVSLLRLDHPDFAKVFVCSCTQRLEVIHMNRCIKHIEISGAGVANGVFDKDPAYERVCYTYRQKKTANLGQDAVNFIITKHSRPSKMVDWAIIAVDGTYFLNDSGQSIIRRCCWVAPCSVNLNFPPKSGWKKVDPLVDGSPEISFILNDKF